MVQWEALTAGGAPNSAPRMEVIECPGGKTAVERNSVIGLKARGAEVMDDFGSCPSAAKKLDFCTIYEVWEDEAICRG